MYCNVYCKFVMHSCSDSQSSTSAVNLQVFQSLQGPEHLSTVLVPLQDDLDPAERSGRFLKERLFYRLEGFF